MSLPSKYAPGGISTRDSRRTLTLGRNKNKAAEYTERRISQRVNTAIADHDGDIEMIAIDDDYEVNAISQYVRSSRDGNDYDMYWENQPSKTSSTKPHISDDLNHRDQLGFKMHMRLISPLTPPPATLFLVVDTNFIISHLDIVNQLLRLAPSYGLKIIIPITVMKELDGLKNSTKTDLGESIGKLARWANNWIYLMLAESNQSVRGQKLTEKLDSNTYQDDLILDCCLYIQKHNKKSIVVLLSNDKNFCLKALANDILTVSYRKSMSAELIATTVYSEAVERYGNRPVLELQDIEMADPKIEAQKTVHEEHGEYKTRNLNHGMRIESNREITENRPKHQVAANAKMPTNQVNGKSTTNHAINGTNNHPTNVKINHHPTNVKINHPTNGTNNHPTNVKTNHPTNVKTNHSTNGKTTKISRKRSFVDSECDQVPQDTGVSLMPLPQDFGEKSWEIFNQVQMLLISVVHKCMESGYGDTLDLVQGYDPAEVTSVDQCVRVILRFWQTVFSEYFQNARNNLPFEETGNKKRRVRIPVFTSVPLRQAELSGFVKHWAPVLNILYSKEMDKRQNEALAVLISRWMTGI